MITLPRRPKTTVIISDEDKKVLDMEFGIKCEKLEVCAVGENIEGISVGDLVFIPIEELRRGTFIEIDGDQKLIINYLAVAIVW